MKALVVGGTGFIGSHIVRNLLAQGIQVRVLARKNSSTNHLCFKEIEIIRGNILEADFVRNNTKDIDFLFSTFGILGQWGTPEQTYWDVNAKGVKTLLKSCIHRHIKQFIHISSAGVLGPLPDNIIADESFPFNPSNIYERSKCEAEKEIFRHGKEYKIPYTIVRPEFVYGPGDMHVLGLFRAIKAKRFFLLGNGESLLHPTYIDDVVRGIILCIGNDKAIGKTFLVTGETPLTVKELSSIISEELDVKLPGLRIPLSFAYAIAKILECGAKILTFDPPLTEARVKFFTENRAFSYQKARNELGYFPQVDFRSGVKATIRWYRENKYL